MKATRAAMALFLCSAVTATLSAQGGDAFYGIFHGKAFDGTRDMEWQLLRNKDGITVSVTIKDPKDPKSKKSPRNLALGSGRDIKQQGDALEFTLQWSPSHQLKGPKDAKYVAEIKGDTLLVKWAAGDEKGELQARNQNPAVAKKGDKNDDKKNPAGNAQRVYLSGLMDSKGVPVVKGTITQLAIIIVTGKSSKA
jgi:hypothetical protein